MAKCVMIVPWGVGQPDFKGQTVTGYVCASYVPPLAGAANYVLVWMSAAQTVIDTLAARTDCLLVCNIVKDANGGENFETAALTATQRNTVRTKIANMGFSGAAYGLLNAAIQASQNRDALAFAIATRAFYRDTAKHFMTDADVAGTFLGG